MTVRDIDDWTAARLNRAEFHGSLQQKTDPDAAEGGCGVVGLASEVPVAGKYLHRALRQMRNRGNGKGGGVAMVGLDPAAFGVDSDTMNNARLYGVAYLNAEVRPSIEERIYDIFDIAHIHEMKTVGDWRNIPGLEVAPPDVVLYFVYPRKDAISLWLEQSKLRPQSFDDRDGLEDAFVNAMTFELNAEFYSSELGNQAFVLCHGKDLLILKLVGFAEDVISYYQLDEVTAHIWIGHHRYPTKGRVWHPGGAHPFLGTNEALVHNGDFANYESVRHYLAQRGMAPLFLTDTEVAALAFDLHMRVYGYPLEMVIESLAPTTELDLALLPAEKQEIYRDIQATHIHGSPDGPWFFIIAQNWRNTWRLIGITDTSMLRPQVFAVQRGEVGIAFCASEKQVIDAVLEDLSAEDGRFWSKPDRTWVARGGSYTDGGAFIFDLEDSGDGSRRLVISDKFGQTVPSEFEGIYDLPDAQIGSIEIPSNIDEMRLLLSGLSADEALGALQDQVISAVPGERVKRIDLLFALLDRKGSFGGIRPSRWKECIVSAILEIFHQASSDSSVDLISIKSPGLRPSPESPTQVLALDARDHDIEGIESLARELIALQKLGWKRIIVHSTRGHRFIGNGFGPDSCGLRLDILGSSGDYLGSGIDGLEIQVHGSGQDQLAQIMRSGRLVVHGDVGQAFGYGAKGGEILILGDAAGRPMINAVGSPQVVINGTCLDYLAESFMAGDPLDGGGFVIVNGLSIKSDGTIVDLPTPYPGGNLFSLGSGGAIYIRDPHKKVAEVQLNGGEFRNLSNRDWAVISPLLELNAKEFGITIERLLTVDGVVVDPKHVYRRVSPSTKQILHAETAWVGHRE